MHESQKNLLARIDRLTKNLEQAKRDWARIPKFTLMFLATIPAAWWGGSTVALGVGAAVALWIFVALYITGMHRRGYEAALVDAQEELAAVQKLHKSDLT